MAPRPAVARAAGRGLSQLTGRENYEAVGRKMALDLVGDPDVVNHPDDAVAIACCDMIEVCRLNGKSCLDYARDDDVKGVTRALNGGLIGLSDREDWLRKWRTALKV